MHESKFDVEAVREQGMREQRGFSSPTEEFQLAQVLERKTSKCIFVSVTIHHLGSIDVLTGTFNTRFDVNLRWCNAVLGDTERFIPLIRFPGAVEWSKTMEDVVYDDDTFSYARMSICGTFRFPQYLQNFPFDIQGLKITLQLGINRLGSPTKYLSIEDGFALVQDPEHPTLIDRQVDEEYFLRPARYYYSETSKIMSRGGTRSKFVVVVPAQRQSKYWLFNNYGFVCLCQLMSFSAFAIPPDGGNSLADTLTVTLTVLLLMVAYKFSIAATMPKLSYMTHFDKYMITVTSLIFLQYVATTFAITFLPTDDMRRGMFNLFIISLCVACGTHALIFRSGRMAMLHQLDGLHAMGRVDECARRTFQEAGVLIDESGKVDDLSAYQKALIQVARK